MANTPEERVRLSRFRDAVTVLFLRPDDPEYQVLARSVGVRGLLAPFALTPGMWIVWAALGALALIIAMGANPHLAHVSLVDGAVVVVCWVTAIVVAEMHFSGIYLYKELTEEYLEATRAHHRGALYNITHAQQCGGASYADDAWHDALEHSAQAKVSRSRAQFLRCLRALAWTAFYTVVHVLAHYVLNIFNLG